MATFEEVVKKVQIKFKILDLAVKAVFHSAKKSEQDWKFCQDFPECIRSLNTIEQYQKTEQKKLAEKKVENFQLSWQIFKLKF